MGAFNGCSSDEGPECSEDREREKITDRPGTKMGVVQPKAGNSGL